MTTHATPHPDRWSRAVCLRAPGAALHRGRYRGHARIGRGYFPNGLLKGDTLRLARWDRSGFASDRYVLGYTYDLAGRRLTMSHPGSVLAGAQTTYSYASWGPLDGMTATFGPGHSFSWIFRTDDAGRPSSLSMPGNLTADFAYDSAGQFVRRQLGALFNDTLAYDARGKLRVADMRAGDGTFTSWYSGLGALVGARWEKGNGVTVDEYRMDAHGNTYWSWKRNALTVDTILTRYTALGLLDSYQYGADSASRQDEGYRAYDAANNVQYATDEHLRGEGLVRDAGRSYYGADQKLRRVERYLAGGTTPRVSLFRYDALGRRVVTMDSGCAGDCDNAITRVIWDGDELLYEQRGGIATPEVASGTGTKYGTVGYVHGLSLDQPIGLYRMGFTSGNQFIVPHANFRGHFVRGTDSTGANCCSGVNWPAPSMGAFMEGAPGPSDWIGSLIQDQRDMSGLLYRRNRYYDPATGRFTQQDPIGLAGGLNLFGFAGGDPVNFADPFGLSPQMCPPVCPFPLPPLGGELPGLIPLLQESAKTVISGIEGALESAKEGIRSRMPQGHHLATDKNSYWTPVFQKMFDKAGMSMQDPANVVPVFGHQGPHSDVHHMTVQGALLQATYGKSGAAYTKAFRATLTQLGVEAMTPGTPLNLMITKP